MASNPIVRFGKIYGITAKEMHLKTGLSLHICNDILTNPLKEVTPETEAAVMRWMNIRIPGMPRPFAGSNITVSSGRPGLKSNHVMRIERKKNFGETCPTCNLAMPLSGACCDKGVNSTSN